MDSLHTLLHPNSKLAQQKWCVFEMILILLGEGLFFQGLLLYFVVSLREGTMPPSSVFVWRSVLRFAHLQGFGWTTKDYSGKTHLII